MSEIAYREKVLKVEPFGIEPIPKEERHGRPGQMFTLWFAGFLGVEFGLSLSYAILAIVIGNVTGAAFFALASAIGPELGHPLISASRKAFGKSGVVWLSFLNFVDKFELC